MMTTKVIKSMLIISGVLLTITGFQARGQSKADVAAFAAASIHKVGPDQEVMLGFLSSPGGRVRFGGTTKELIALALGVPEFKIDGLPQWATDDRYDIQAVSPSSVDTHNGASRPPAANPTQVERAMLLSLLRERFHLEYRTTHKEGRVYEMIRVKESKLLTPTTHSNADPRGAFMITSTGALNGDFMGINLSMHVLAEDLSEALGVDVTDRTGLTGRYDIRVHSEEPNTGDAADGALMAIKPLGLALHSTRGDTEHFFVAHISTPTAN